MGEDEEAITIPTETQGLTTLRRQGLVIFFSVSIILLAATVVVSMMR